MAGGGAVKVEISVASWADLDTLILGFFPHRKFRRVTVQINIAGSWETNLKDGSEWTWTTLLSYFQDSLEVLWLICVLKSMFADNSLLYWVPRITDRGGNTCGTLPRQGSIIQFLRTGAGEHPGNFECSSKTFLFWEGHNHWNLLLYWPTSRINLSKLIFSLQSIDSNFFSCFYILVVSFCNDITPIPLYFILFYLP